MPKTSLAKFYIIIANIYALSGNVCLTLTLVSNDVRGTCYLYVVRKLLDFECFCERLL